MDYISLIFALLLLIAFSALFSGMEIAYLSTDRLRLLIDKSRGGPVSSVLRRLFRNTGLYITTMLVGNNIVLVMYGLVMSTLLNPLLEKLIPDWAVLILTSLIATFIILIFGEYLPKFKKVLPHDYDKMLRLIAQMEEKGEDSEQAQIEAFYAMKNAANK